MKQEFSTAWIGSKQARKQRKYRYNAPLHIRRSFIKSPLSSELKTKYGIGNVSLRKGDEVEIVKGKFAKKKGKIIEIDLRRTRVVVENINRTRKDGTKVNVFLRPSNLRAYALNMEDIKRLKRKRKTEKEKSKNGTLQKG